MNRVSVAEQKNAFVAFGKCRDQNMIAALFRRHSFDLQVERELACFVLDPKRDELAPLDIVRRRLDLDDLPDHLDRLIQAVVEVRRDFGRLHLERPQCAAGGAAAAPPKIWFRVSPRR